MSDNSSLVLSFLSDARALIEDSNFQRQCLDRLLVLPDVSSIGFVDGLGQPSSNALNSNITRSDIWGINYTTCNTFCNSKDMSFPFSYSTFSSAMTNYILPWLALTAQLPYETGSHPANIMAFFMALGSPVLITYSLSLAVIHSYKLKTQFNQLRVLKNIDPPYERHLMTIRDVLQAAQHVPLRASQYNGWLSSLLILRGNDPWWWKVKEYLMGRVREFSPSALAQIGVAVVAWLLTIVAALSTKLGDPDTGLQIASGSLWIWLVPVVFGYIKVGVPNSSRATPEAFIQGEAVNAAAVNTAPAGHNTLVDNKKMRGIRTAGDVFQSDGAPVNSDDMPHALGMSVLGDSGTPGAAYTYARSLEFPFFVERIYNALRYYISESHKHNLDDSPEGIAKHCGQEWQVNMTINPFPKCSEVTADSWKRMFTAALIGLFVQWGTTMASFMLAFLTPVQGLGCRSGSYVVYGVVSTVAWVLLVVAQLCSNEAMRVFQESQWTQARQVSDLRYEISKTAAVICRLSGKALCILNTFWLLLTSIAEIIGGFDNCWCLANRPSAGLDSWIVLFKTSEDLASRANSSWGGGFAITIFVSFLAIAVFTIGSPRHESE